MALDFATYQSSPSVGPSVRTVGLDRSPDCSPVQSVHEPRTGLDRHVIGLDWTGLRAVGPVQSSRSSPRLRTLVQSSPRIFLDRSVRLQSGLMVRTDGPTDGLD